MKKLILIIFLFLCLSYSYGDNFKVYIGLTQPITPAMSIEKNNKMLVTLDILSKLDLDFKSAGKNMLILEKCKKQIHLYDYYNIPFVDMIELANAMGIDYIKKNNSITIYNKIISASCNNGCLNVEFAFSSTYEYSYWNNMFMVDLIGSVHNPKAIGINKDNKNVSDIVFGQVTLDSARCMFKLNQNVVNTKPVREFGSELSVKLNIISKLKNTFFDDIKIYSDNKDNVIEINGGANLKYNVDENVDTGVINISFSGGSFDTKIQKEYKTKSMVFDVGKDTIKSKTKEIKEISVKVKSNDLIITLSPPKGIGKSFGNLKITIDPGHGGKDSGAVYKSLYEKNINYNASLALKKELEKRGAIVNLTRDENGFLSLSERGQIAIDTKSDIFISIHTNSTAGENKASGLETYYRGPMFSSEYLGKQIHGQIIKNLAIPNKGLKKDTSLYSTGLGVLRKCNSDNIPCLLIELGFINHSTDRAYLQDENYYNYIAKSVADGIEKYIKGIPYGK